MTENLSALELAELGFSAVAYPFMLVAAKLKSIRETLQALKTSLPIGPPPTILSAAEVCEGVGFNKYWVSNVSKESDMLISDFCGRLSRTNMLHKMQRQRWY
jgi:hypothetical protein